MGTNVEHILDMVIWELAGLDQMTGSCMTAPQFTYRARVNMIMALVARNRMSPNAVGLAKALKKMVANNAHIRNNYIHNAWYIEEKNGGPPVAGQLFSFSFGNPHFGFKPVDMNQFENDIATLTGIAANASELAGALLPSGKHCNENILDG